MQNSLHPSIPRVALTAAFIFGATSCVHATWRDRALQDRPDRATPELAFESLRAAIRCDDPMFAYRLISERMKERDNFAELMFIAGWDAFFQKYPLARLSGNAEIVKSTPLADGRVVVLANAHGREIKSTWIEEHYYEVEVRGRGKIDGFVNRVAGQLQHGREGVGEFLARCADARLEGVDVNDVTSFRIAIEWKLLDFERN
ncbi:MAG: hypothetical protein HY286_15375 [Planctomycetes bacterium]|nr:hypothetical protein [Planctomycetota bacterium]